MGTDSFLNQRIGIGRVLSLCLFSLTLYLKASLAESMLEGKNCDIWDDEQGIPHIHVKGELLGLACFGYIHGRDRAWEMDFFRKTVQGRKSELFGVKHLRSDFILKLIGLEERADALYQKLDRKLQDRLAAYSFGVNQGIKDSTRDKYEFKYFNYTPEPWKPQDSLGLILLQSFDQTRRSFEIQSDQEKWESRYKEAAESLFDPRGLPWDTFILKEGEYPKSSSLGVGPAHNRSQYPPEIPFIERRENLALQSGVVSRGQSGGVRNPVPTFTTPAFKPGFIASGQGTGSNSWVIGLKRSSSPHAWLANDPHLQLTRPSFWHWIHLSIGPDTDVIGASFPGVPLIASGTNRHVSWGLTNSYLPVSQVSAVPEAELANAKTYQPLIWVKIWKVKIPFYLGSFRRTAKNLPILPGETAQGRALVLNWSGFDLEPKDITALLDLPHVKNVAEADQVFSRMGVPSWNFVFADDQGSIGFRTVGRTPRHRSHHRSHRFFGISNLSLSDVENAKEFSKPLTPDEMPHVLYPRRGFIVTANNSQWASDGRWNIGNSQVPAFRAFRIEELLRGSSEHNLESIRRIQCDVQAVDARFVLPLLIKTLEKQLETFPKKDEITTAIEELKKWDFETHLNCRPCGLYRRWIDRIFLSANLNYPALYRKLTAPADPVFVENIKNLFFLALEDLKYSKKGQLPKWGEIHRNYFEHLAGAGLFATPPFSTPGDEHTINPGSGIWTGKEYQHRVGASQRLIVQMSTPPKVYSILAGPNDEIQKWVNCKLNRRNFPVNWSHIAEKVKRVTLQ